MGLLSCLPESLVHRVLKDSSQTRIWIHYGDDRLSIETEAILEPNHGYQNNLAETIALKDPHTVLAYPYRHNLNTPDQPNIIPPKSSQIVATLLDTSGQERRVWAYFFHEREQLPSIIISNPETSETSRIFLDNITNVNGTTIRSALVTTSPIGAHCQLNFQIGFCIGNGTSSLALWTENGEPICQCYHAKQPRIITQEQASKIVATYLEQIQSQ